ncbi:hypothetical protein Glove_81g73 [Diversispora epigaea]|uniref:Protein kinase domain-containing protein n=1 Tax=Diversispora epigaea TaxID=1348612 RepID=A0A397JES0_9GLOM|nr:hypothetical protein Glove_81g73 [Diversispora epigaea]
MTFLNDWPFSYLSFAPVTLVIITRAIGSMFYGLMKILVYCSDDHFSDKNYTRIDSGYCDLCNKEHFSQEYGTWSCRNVEIDKVIQEFQTSHQGYYEYMLQWIPYDNFQDIEHITDGGYGSVYSAILKNVMKHRLDSNKLECVYVDNKVALKEINDSRNDASKFFEEILNIQIVEEQYFIASYFGISKNPISQNYIIVMKLYDDSLHKFLTKHFSNLSWKRKTYYLNNIANGLNKLHTKKLVHRDLHSGNILIDNRSLHSASITDLGLCRLANDLILKSDNKSNNIYGSIPYIPPEVLRGNEFTKNGDIYSFGGIMYEMATGKQPFYDRAHDTRLIIDICNGLRPKIPDNMLDWMPKWYSDLMCKCWNDDPSKRPAANELRDALWDLYVKLRDDKIDEGIQQFKIADENQEKTIISQKKESSLSSSISHPQSCYISRRIHTLHGLHNSLEDIKSGKSQDPNLLKSNELTSSIINTYDIDSKESQECIDWEKEIQNRARKRSFSTLDCDSHYINLKKGVISSNSTNVYNGNGFRKQQINIHLMGNGRIESKKLEEIEELEDE